MSYPIPPDPGPKKNCFSVRIIEAKLVVNVASFGRMHLVAEVRHGTQVFRTKVAERGDQQPRWDEMHIFELASEPTVHIKVLHSAFLMLGDTVIGACGVPLPLASKRKRSGWWDLRDEAQQSVGSIRLSFGFDVDNAAAAEGRMMDSICSELKERVRIKVNELELEKEELEFLKLKYRRKAEKLNQIKRIYRSKVQNVTEVRVTVTRDDNELRGSPRAEDEPGRRQKSMALREELLVIEQRRLDEERGALEREKAEVEKLREEVSTQTAELEESGGYLPLSSPGREESPPADARPLRMSLSHDNLPTLDDYTLQQLDEIRQMRLTLNQKQEIWEKSMRETDAKRKDVEEKRRALAKRRSDAMRRAVEN